MRYLILLSCALLFTGCAADSGTQTVTEKPETITETATPKLMGWGDLMGRPLPSTPHSITYGDRKNDVVDVWIPDGEGPHPVVLMVHGGCWQKAIADRTLMNYAAEDLRQNGMAVWNIEYRGVDEEGGGYPGTFTDVSNAADAMRSYAAEYQLDLDKVAGFGHSAGGHLVTWLATRKNLPADNPLYSADPLPMVGLINTGGLADLEASAPVTQASCLADIMDTLTGLPDDSRSDVFADTSPSELLPGGTTIISVNGDSDRIAPSELGLGFTEKALKAGDTARFVQVKNTGHVELISPQTEAFETQTEILKELLGL